MKDGKEVTEILESFDLTGSLRAAGELAGCSPHTVAGWVAKRDRGELGELVAPACRGRMIDPFMASLTVRHTITAVDHARVAGGPKSARSRRNIDIDEGTVRILRTWRREER